MMKDSRVKIRTGRYHSPVTVTEKNTELGDKRKFNLSPIKSELDNEK